MNCNSIDAMEKTTTRTHKHAQQSGDEKEYPEMIFVDTQRQITYNY